MSGTKWKFICVNLTNMEEYLKLKTEFEEIRKNYLEISKYVKAFETIKKGPFDHVEQANSVLQYNLTMLTEKLITLEAYKMNSKRFSIVLLVDDDRKIWLSRRNNVSKDFYDQFQAAGGKCEDGESYANCAIREVEEETGIRLTEDRLHWIMKHEYFSEFEGIERLYKCAIFYASVKDKVPERREVMNNDEWKTYTLTTMSEMRNRLTLSLNEKFDEIRRVLLKVKKKKRPLGDVNGDDEESNKRIKEE